MKWWDQMPRSYFSECWALSQLFHSSFTFIKRLFSSFSLSAIRVVSSAFLRLLVCLPAILIPVCASSSPAFLMMYSAYKSNKQGDNIQPFPIWNQSVVPCPVLIVASWPAYRFRKRQVRWLYSLFYFLSWFPYFPLDYSQFTKILNILFITCFIYLYHIYFNPNCLHCLYLWVNILNHFIIFRIFFIMTSHVDYIGLDIKLCLLRSFHSVSFFIHFAIENVYVYKILIPLNIISSYYYASTFSLCHCTFLSLIVMHQGVGFSSLIFHRPFYF